MILRNRLPSNLWRQGLLVAIAIGLLAAQATASGSIAQAKLLPDGSGVSLAAKRVTGVFTDCIYIVESDRSAGIQVVPIQRPSGLGIGVAVTVTSTINTAANGERCINGTVTIN